MKFCPSGSSQNVDSDGSGTGRITLSTVDAINNAVRIYNADSADIYVRFGNSSVTAAQYDCPIHGFQSEVFIVPSGATAVAFYGASGNTVCVTAGQAV